MGTGIKHTPGPHKAIQDGRGEWHVVGPEAPDAVTEARYDFLAEVHPRAAGRVLYRDGAQRRIEPGEAEANARLFAAAAELRASLDALLEQADEQYPHFESERGTANRERARAALAAALQ